METIAEFDPHGGSKRKTSGVVVLLSGGQDSTTSLYWAKHMWPGAPLYALTILYGQRHATELEAAGKVAELAKVDRHTVVDIPPLLFGSTSSLYGASALVDPTKPLTWEGGIPDREMPQGLPSSFVPGRNLVFLAIGAAHAAALGADVLVTGVCQTDYSGYPDCRRDFVDAVEAAGQLAMPSSHPTAGLVISTPLMHLTKAQTVELARSLPGCWDALSLTVTCYQGFRPGCGECPACALRKKGFDEAGEVDPARSR